MTPTHTGTNIDFQPTGCSGQTNPLPKLKPCPFCNGSASYAFYVRSRNSTQQFVVCDDCGAESKLCDSREEAAAVWNRRADNG